MKIDEFYRDVVCGLVAQMPDELNARTGQRVRALPGVTFQTDLRKDGFPLLSLRKMPMSFVPEVMWMLSGSSNIEWLSKHTKIWDSFAEKNGEITSAYGKRWRKWSTAIQDAEPVDQLGAAISKLKDDSSSRHAVIMTWNPDTDVWHVQKNVPCVVLFTLNIVRDRLHLHVVFRSNDMVLGFPTDVAGFALLQEIFAQELGIEAGSLTHSISNCHVYAMHDRVVEQMAVRSLAAEPVRLRLPPGSYGRACRLDDALVEEIKAGFSGYNPHAAVKNIPIAL